MTNQIFRSNKGFTLIELLIVVAIIAILAAIAVPNFLEAQTRSKVSRAKSDMRSLATAVESYRVDYNAYPKCNNFGVAGARPAQGELGVPSRLVLERLSTPIAYMTSAFLRDPFETKFRTGTINSTDGSFTPNPAQTTTDANAELTKNIKYFTPGPTGLQDVEAAAERAKWYYILVSNGPDVTYPNLGGVLDPSATSAAVCNNVYDPTNGTVSIGDIFRIGGTTTGTPGTDYGARFFEVVQQVQK